jgi:hypothetical protein
VNKNVLLKIVIPSISLIILKLSGAFCADSENVAFLKRAEEGNVIRNLNGPLGLVDRLIFLPQLIFIIAAGDFVIVGVTVGVSVGVTVLVGVGVLDEVCVHVEVVVGVLVFVGVDVVVFVGVGVLVFVGVAEGVDVEVFVGVVEGVIVGVFVLVGVTVEL